MKNTLASLLVLNTVSILPHGAISFTSRPPVAVSIRTGNSAFGTTQLHGLLPSFQTRNKDTADDVEVDGRNTDVPSASEEAIPREMTELALDTSADASVPAEADEGEELSEAQELLRKVKQAGTAGAISYALWELGFWGISIPVCVVGYRELTGHWPDFSSKEDVEKLGAEAFAFVNFARFAVPLRIGLALSTTPWIDENIVQKFKKRDDEEDNLE